MDIEERIRDMGMEKAYNWLLDEEVDERTYEAVRFGVNLKFDINEYLEGWIVPKPKSRLVVIAGKLYKSKDFFTEIENRKRMAKAFLLQEYSEKNPVKVRGNGRRISNG